MINFAELEWEKDDSLRDYQVENKKKIYEAWGRYDRVMLQMPTGTGKTRLFVSIAKDLHSYAEKRGGNVRILLMAHRVELIMQISESVSRYGLAHGIIKAGVPENPTLDIQVASVATLSRRLEKWADKKFDIIIVDEAHHTKADSYNKIIEEFADAKILGVTATPMRLNGASLKPEYETLIESWPVSRFIKRGYLSDYSYYSINGSSPLQERINHIGLDAFGDYSDEGMMMLLDNRDAVAEVVDTYKKFAGDKRGIVYAIGKSHSVHLRDKFREAGYRAESIDSSTPSEVRSETVAKFRQGEIDVLCNVNIFTEGFDCPDVEVVQLARPTMSLTMYLQQVGRGLRRSSVKHDVMILDNVGSINRFGFPSAMRDWNKLFDGDYSGMISEFQEEDRVVTEIVCSAKADSRKWNDNNIAPSQRKNFTNYLLNVLRLKPVSSYVYVNAIEKRYDGMLGEILGEEYANVSVFNITDADVLTKFINVIKKDKKYEELKKNSREAMAGMHKYIEFLKMGVEDIQEMENQTVAKNITIRRADYGGVDIFATNKREVEMIKNIVEYMKEHKVDSVEELERRRRKIESMIEEGTLRLIKNWIEERFEGNENLSDLEMVWHFAETSDKEEVIEHDLYVMRSKYAKLDAALKNLADLNIGITKEIEAERKRIVAGVNKLQDQKDFVHDFMDMMGQFRDRRIIVKMERGRVSVTEEEPSLFD